MSDGTNDANTLRLAQEAEALQAIARARWKCGKVGHNEAAIALTDAQFVWLPRDVQCDSCAIKAPHLPRGEDRIVDGIAVVRVACATAEMQTTVETIVLAIHRLAECPVVPHKHVWLPYVCGVEGVDPQLNPWRCTCGAFSRDGKTINGESFYGIHRSVADVLEPLAPETGWSSAVWYGNEGGWAAVGPHHDHDGLSGDDDAPGSEPHQMATRDAAFIAASRTLVPQMLAEIERLREVVDARTPTVHVVGIRSQRDEALAEIERLRAEVAVSRARLSANPTPCSCQYEVGDSPCARHPTCNACGVVKTSLDAACPECDGFGNLTAAEAQERGDG